MSYKSVGGITQKNQHHEKKGNIQKKTTYDLAYTYGDTQPHAPIHIGKQPFTYDANGNQLGWKDDVTGQRRNMHWDEENRLRAVNDNGAYHHYTYDAAGERVLKGQSTGQRIFVNGKWKAGSGQMGNYTVYVNPYLVLKSGGYTKHYYIEGQRIVSKLGGGWDNNGQGPLKAGNGKVDYNGRGQKVFDGIVKNLKFLGADGQILTAGKSGKVPPGQINGTGNVTEAFRYFYHPDHLGSTSSITDASGEVFQHPRVTGADWSIRETLFNGVRLDWKKFPELPIIGRDAVLALPLELNFDKRYVYLLEDVDEVAGRRCWRVAFEPAGENDGSLYRGRAWIEQRSGALVRVSRVQLTLRPPLISDEETQTYRPFEGPDGTSYWLLDDIDGQQIYTVSGQNLVVLRRTRFGPPRINDPGFETARAGAYASERQMLRDTDGGMKWLSRQPDGSGLASEGERTPADLLLTNDAGSLELARGAGLLRPLNMREVERAIPSQFRAADNSWVGLSGRFWIIVYNTTMVKPDQLNSLLDLANPQWKDKLAIPNSGSEYLQAGVSVIRAAHGDERTKKSLEGLRDNAGSQVYQKSSQIVDAVAKGQVAVGIVNHYYLYRHLATQSTAPLAVIRPDQKDGGMGAIMNVTGIGITKPSTHVDNAKLLIEFLVAQAGQKMFADLDKEYPLHPEVKADPALVDRKSFRTAQVPLTRLAELREPTLTLIEQVGLR